jgi:hypothetical protein
MKIPYLKELLLVSLGLNLSFFSLSVAMGSTGGAVLALGSGAMCVFGIWFYNGQEEDDGS